MLVIFCWKKAFLILKKNTITCLFFLWEVNCFVVFEPFARIYHPENWNLFFYYFGSKIQIFFSISWNSIGLLENSNQVNWKKLSKMLNFGFPKISWKKSSTFTSLLLLRKKHLIKKNECMFCAVVGIYRLVGKCSWAKNSFGKTLSSFWSSPLKQKERLWEQKKALKGSWAKNAPNMSWDTAGTGFSLNYSSRNTVKKFSSQLLFANGFIVSINRRCDGLAKAQKIIIQCRKCNHEPGDLGLEQVGTKYRWLT